MKFVVILLGIFLRMSSTVSHIGLFVQIQRKISLRSEFRKSVFGSYYACMRPHTTSSSTEELFNRDFDRYEDLTVVRNGE